MDDQETSPLYAPHSRIRSRTPEARFAERAQRFQEKRAGQAAAQAAKNAQPRAGRGVRVDGPMITADGSANAAEGSSATGTSGAVEVTVTGVLNGQRAAGVALFRTQPEVIDT